MLALWVGLPRPDKSCVRRPGPPHRGHWRAAPSPQRRLGRLALPPALGRTLSYFTNGSYTDGLSESLALVLALVSGTRTGCALEDPLLFL